MLLYCFIPPPDPPHTLTGVTFRPRPSSTSATRRQTVHSCVPQTSVWGEGRRAVAMETLRMPSPSGEWLEVHSAFLRENVSNFLYPPLSPSSPSPPSPLPLSSLFPLSPPLPKHSTHRYKREFGFTIPSRSIIVDDIRVRGTARACSHQPTLMMKVSHPPRVATVSPVRQSRLIIHFLHVAIIIASFLHLLPLQFSSEGT